MSLDAFMELEPPMGEEPTPEELPAELRANGSTYGRNVARHFEWLDRVCREIQCRPIGSFLVDQQDVDLTMDGDLVDAGPWFEASEAIPTVEALIRHLTARTSHPRLAALQGVGVEHLLWDLAAYEILLRRAQASGRRFRIVLC
jgi:hypothetical protein